MWAVKESRHLIMFYLKVEMLDEECDCLCDEAGSNLPSNTNWCPQSWQWLITSLYLFQTFIHKWWLLHHLFWLKNHIIQLQESEFPTNICVCTQRLRDWEISRSLKADTRLHPLKLDQVSEEAEEIPLLGYVSNH